MLLKRIMATLSIALAVALTALSCKKSNNEPSTPPATANYLVGKTFTWGSVPTSSSTESYNYVEFTFTDRKLTASNQSFEKGDPGPRVNILEWPYTYQNGVLKFKEKDAKVIKAQAINNGKIVDNTEKEAEKRKRSKVELSGEVDEKAGTINLTDNEEKSHGLFTLKK